MSKNKRGYYDSNDDDNRRKKSRRDHVNEGSSYRQESFDEYDIRQRDVDHRREKFQNGKR